MRRFLIAILFLPVNLIVAQTMMIVDSSDCNISILYSSKPEKIEENINLKLNTWRLLINKCPDSNEILYIKGEEIFKYLIENETDNNKKQNLIDTLMLNFDLRLRYFHDTANVYLRKTDAILKYNPSNFVETYKLIKKSIDLEPLTEPHKYLKLMEVSKLLKENNLLLKEEFDENKETSLKKLRAMLEIEEKENRKEIIQKTIDKIK